MTQVIMEIYEAFKDAGASDEKAQSAAAVISEKFSKQDKKTNELKK